MVRSFDEIWQKTSPIYGAFTKDEAQELYNKADSLGKGATLVEIGSYCGKSSSVLGMVAHDNQDDLTCVDNFMTGIPSGEDVRETFIANMESGGARYILLPISSQEASIIYHKEIDLLFIDGDHLYRGVKLDCELWLPKLKVNGWALFHDYESSWEGIKKAVDELEGFSKIKLANSMAILQKLR